MHESRRGNERLITRLEHRSGEKRITTQNDIELSRKEEFSKYHSGGVSEKYKS